VNGSRFSIGRWRKVGGAAVYVLALLTVANAVFLAGMAGGGGIGFNLARTGTYRDVHVPAVAALDPGRIASAVTEAGGGPATLARRAPDELTAGGGGSGASGSGQRTVPQAGPQATTSTTTISAGSTPTYTGATVVSTISIASLLAEIPLTVTFPPGAHKAATRGR
jgi:hypothetical protein